MSDVMAIVSKAVFEKVAGKSPSLGTALGMDRYVSANKGLAPLEGGGTLYLVTVRPPDEALWLVAVLANPAFSGTEWIAAACTTPMIDISGLKAQLVFENGKGLPTTKGTLGMSLQTPRVLTAADVALLKSVLSSAPMPTTTAPVATPAAKVDPAAPLLAAVVATPHDDAPKRALGAHWRSVNEPRGELVELDLALRDRMSVPKRKHARAQREALLAAHSSRWWPWDVMASRQRAGFLTWVRADAASFLAIAPKLFAAEPIVELDLLGLDEESIGDLAKASWLARLSALGAHGELGDEGFATLVKSKHLANLGALNVSGTGLTSEGIAAMEKVLPSLHRLVLTNNPLGDEGIEALVAWKHLSGLRTLYLTACELTDDGLAMLANSGKLGALEKLTIANNEGISDAGIQAIANAKALPNLAYLELKGLDIRDPAGAAIAAARFPRLTHLDLRGVWGIDRDDLRRVYPNALTGE